MKMKINQNELELIVGDITQQKKDAIVNAANGTLLGGGGVDGAIHRAAGAKRLEECKEIREGNLQGKYLPTGKAVITGGYQLPARYVIHTVGPVWKNNTEDEDEKLAACYKNSLQLAEEHRLTSISFPSISTGGYRYPVDPVPNSASLTIVELLQHNQLGRATMTLIKETDDKEYETALKHISLSKEH